MAIFHPALVIDLMIKLGAKKLDKIDQLISIILITKEETGFEYDYYETHMSSKLITL